MSELAHVHIVLPSAQVSQQRYSEKVGDGIMASARDTVVREISEYLAVHNH